MRSDGRDINIGEMMDRWTLQMGYPVVTVSKNQSDQLPTHYITVSQEHFLYGQGVWRNSSRLENHLKHDITVSDRIEGSWSSAWLALFIHVHFIPYCVFLFFSSLHIKFCFLLVLLPAALFSFVLFSVISQSIPILWIFSFVWFLSFREPLALFYFSLCRSCFIYF